MLRRSITHGTPFCKTAIDWGYDASVVSGGNSIVGRRPCEKLSTSTWTRFTRPWSSATTRRCAVNRSLLPGRASARLFVLPRTRRGASVCILPCRQSKRNAYVPQRPSYLRISLAIARSRAVYGRSSHYAGEARLAVALRSYMHRREVIIDSVLTLTWQSNLPGGQCFCPVALSYNR
jgi:hypothetical protein